MTSSDTRIVFDGVSKTFDTDNGPLTVVDDVSFSVGDGDFISLVGPSGCGKTTMLNMVAGFMQPSAGTVTLDGEPIRGPGAERGMMFQDYGVFPWLSVEDNIAFGLKLKANRVSAAERRRTVDHFMELMGLAEFRKAYPKTLSGGMRQRLALARAYAVNPQFLLMDEPFGALDAQTRTAMQDLLLNVMGEVRKTVMLITHSVEEALYLSSRMLVISARPSRIRRVIEVPFPFPRTEALRDAPEFAELRSEVRDMVMREYAAQEDQARSATAARTQQA
ncbi:ABC transporter ATP-binding protein [Aquisalimonas lutea]|uniref:ABC transporter ATP-binding protein n=1 Tax=Aquisalimonas lutea TaxID=1327750 RepID=UPI0025B2BF46|nr:ABC transporter ATP-binding protein [Aquisalimonas lutea]MDN3516478.1 ABC transporter ATP-binding protein [Aquisalimonas lutea]